MKRQIASILFSVGALTSGSVIADTLGNGWYLEGNIGYSVYDDLNTTDKDRNPGGTDTKGTATVEDSIQFGGAFGFQSDFGRIEFEMLDLRHDYESGAFLGAEELEALAGLVNVWIPTGHSDNRVRPYFGGGVGVASIGASPLRDAVTIGQVGVGIDYRFSPRWVLDTQARYIAATQVTDHRPDEHTYSFRYQGVLLTAGIRRNFFDPTTFRDGDADGVPDKDDECRRSKPGSTVDTKGCAGDSDNDGVNDDDDKCPDTPSGEEVNSRGCSIDPDKDGVLVGIDECPNTPKGQKVDGTGCSNDDDKDGVTNGADACPDTAPGVTVLSNGCGADQEWILRGVYFEFDKSRITQNAKLVLDDAAEIVKSSPGFDLELQGHTDDLGNDEYNQALSLARANEVMDYLISAGVDANRLSAVGYGETSPILPNDSESNRDTNRRVVVKVIGQ